MASYTMELRNYIEMFSQYESLSTKEVIEKGRTKLFDFDYPIFDEAYKKQFETNFIRKFYMREIGFETEGLFKFQLETWLLINMPYFNKLFESELIKYDPLTNTKVDMNHTKTLDKSKNDVRDVSETSKTIGNVDSTTTNNGTTDSTVNVTGTEDSTNSQESDATVTDDNFNRKLNSNNPDSRLAITTNDGQGVIEYASSIEEDNANNTQTSSGNTSGTNNTDTTSDTVAHSESTDTSTSGTDSTVDETANKNDTLASNVNQTEDYVQSRFGKIGIQSYPKMVKDYRESLLRIEKQIFKEMQELFMLVY